MEITFITGNKNKLKEFTKILTNINFQNQELDIVEIQSMDLKEICEKKAKTAYEIIKKPVMVEDTGAFLEELGGLPGPFIKFFEKSLGQTALIKLLSTSKNRNCITRTCITYYDGKNIITSIGERKGIITDEIKPGSGFGFDCCFIPETHTITYSQMGEEEKNKISHRALAIKQFQKDIQIIN